MGTPLDAVKHGLNQLRIRRFDKNGETINGYNCLLHFDYLVADEQVAIATDRPANLGERYERDRCELSPQPTASTQTIDMATLRIFLHPQSATQYWHDHDITSLPFVNFWLMLACYQVDHELTDRAMAEVLFVDHKTIGSWRRFIVNDSALQQVLDRITPKRASVSNTLQRLDGSVRNQIAQVQTVRLTVPSNRAGARLPTDEVFSAVVTCAIPTVINHWVCTSRSLKKPFLNSSVNVHLHEILWGKRNSNDAAAKIATALIGSYSRSPRENHSEALRLKLLTVLGQVAQSEVQMAALRVLSIQPAAQGVDSIRAGDLGLLRSRLPALRVQAGTIAMAYEKKLLEEAAAAEKIDEDDAVHGYPPLVAVPATVSSQSFGDNVKALMDCLAKLQLVPR